MIADVNEAGTLEFFWRHPVSRHPGRGSAIQFALELRRRPEAVAALRQIFPLKRIPRSANGDAATLKRFAAAVATGEFLILQHRGEGGWIGTRAPVVPLTRSVSLLCIAKTLPARNVSKAQSWLQDASAEDLQRLWEGMWIGYRRSGSATPDRAEIVAEADRTLTSGELVAVFHPMPVLAKTVVESEQPAAEGAPVRTAPAEPPETNTFSSDHAPGPQTSALIAAAQSGAPFCEVCARQAAERSAA